MKSIGNFILSQLIEHVNSERDGINFEFFEVGTRLEFRNDSITRDSEMCKYKYGINYYHRQCDGIVLFTRKICYI